MAVVGPMRQSLVPSTFSLAVFPLGYCDSEPCSRKNIVTDWTRHLLNQSITVFILLSECPDIVCVFEGSRASTGL